MKTVLMMMMMMMMNGMIGMMMMISVRLKPKQGDNRTGGWGGNTVAVLNTLVGVRFAYRINNSGSIQLQS